VASLALDISKKAEFVVEAYFSSKGVVVVGSGVVGNIIGTTLYLLN